MHRAWIVLDVETYSDTSAESLLEPPAADKRLTDPAKIAADLEAKATAQRDRMSLDPYAGRVVAVGWQTECNADAGVLTCQTDDLERGALVLIANQIRIDTYQGIRRHVVGYNTLRFDLPFLITRARLLGVSWPSVDLRRYNNRDVTDLYSLLTFDGTLQEGALRRTLPTMARRFGLAVEDETTGADVAQMVREGRWSEVAAHCRSDVALTVALARRVGVIPAGVEVGA